MFGERIRSLRKSRKLTMKQLGDVFNLAESTISGYENETRKPDIEILNKLADYFDVNVDYILGRTDESSPSGNNKKPDNNDFHFYDTDGVQFIARSDKNLSPAAYKKMQELAKKAAELFDEEDED